MAMRIPGSLMILTLTICCQLSFAEEGITPPDDSDQLPAWALDTLTEIDTPTETITQTETIVPVETITQPIFIIEQSFQNITGLAKYIEDRIAAYSAQMKSATRDSVLQDALASSDTSLLSLLEDRLKEILDDSIRVRLYPKGLEEIDSHSTPACGFACLALATRAYEVTPPAEALLYDTPDASITLAHAVFNESGQALGVVVAHYPYGLITESIKQLTDSGLYIEFQQFASGKKNILQKHGNTQAREEGEEATRIIRLKGTKWNLAVWAPGGVRLNEYGSPSIQSSRVVLGVIALAIGIALLALYKRKHLFANIKIRKPD